MNIKNNCRKATFLLEKKQEHKIRFFERVELAIHLAGCPQCRIYKIQSINISRMLDMFFYQSQNTDMTMDEKYKKEIQQSIETTLKKNNDRLL